ncbi:hypothetical protein OpiT1DRAFT_02987 [Opitutaceae bacterium TAV1]|nr:hypothetical protein OpiT1DRAFT_02987 [Opitutaceae bacterium TAV1]
MNRSSPLRFFARAAIVFAALPALGFAQPAVKARVDFLLRDSIEVEVIGLHGTGGEVTEASWSGQRHLVSTFPATKTWQSASITLRARADGRITLIPMSDPNSGKQAASKPTFILFDSFTASDGSIRNGSFEALDAQGNPTWWNGPGGQLDASLRAEVISTVAQDEVRCLRTWHGSKYVQGIALKGGVPVTITFHYRAE